MSFCNSKTFARRDFLKLAGGVGLTVLVSPAHLWSKKDSAPAATPPYWLFVEAVGGWDPTSLCDPKGRRNEQQDDPVNLYFTDAIGTAGHLPYAPIGANESFFTRHHQRMLVLNGIDTETSSHTVGQRYTWSGKIDEGHPALAALIAAAAAPHAPLAFLTFGGFDATAGTIPATRLGSAERLRRVAYPNAIYGDPQGTPFHSEATFQRIISAQSQRLARLQEGLTLPNAKRSTAQLHAARLGTDELTQLADYLPNTLASGSLARQAQVALASFRAGVAKTATVMAGSFDTHSNHDAVHYPLLAQLLEGVDFVWQEAERQGIADELIVVMGSDFGRTPSYNSNGGKDHWSITSMILMGHGIPGNRVIGQTTDRLTPIALDPSTLQPVENGGVRLRPGHIHRALRKLAGIDAHTLATTEFPLAQVQDLPLLA